MVEGGVEVRAMSGGRDRFLALSADLTGFNRVELLGTGMADAYLRTLEEVLPAGMLDALLEPAPLGATGSLAELLADGDLGPVARNLILLWYSGAWTPLPDEWRAVHGTSPLDVHRVVTPEAYVAGLQWTLAAAHPVGARQQGFGAWAMPPEAVQA
jgi:hypothetical protein